MGLSETLRPVGGKLKNGADIEDAPIPKKPEGEAVGKWVQMGGGVLTFSKPIAFGGEIVKRDDIPLCVLGRVDAGDGSIGTTQLILQAKKQGVEVNVLQTGMPKDWSSMKIIDQNAKYWKEINQPFIDDLIASGSDIRFIHDPRLDKNIWNYVDELPERNDVQKQFKAKAKAEGLKRIRTYLSMEYEYLESLGFVLQENGLMIKK